MNLNPQISIITPTKNRRELLREALDSVAAQRFMNWEHIVVDDGSDDGTDAELTIRCSRDSRLRFISREGDKQGANVCRNIGIRASRADLIVFLDSDDLLGPDCLRNRVNAMERNADIDFAVFQNGVFINRCGDISRSVGNDLLGDDLMGFLYFEFPWHTSGPVWRRTSLIELGMFDESLPSWQDVELHVRALSRGQKYIKFEAVDHFKRWQEEPNKVSLLQRRSPAHLEAALVTLDKIELLIKQSPGITWIRQRGLCHLYFFIAEHWVLLGNLRNALNTWYKIRERKLCGFHLYLSGAALLIILSINVPFGVRLTNKWKGLARLRTNAELV